MPDQKPLNISLVIPVYNDWESFAVLLKEIDTAFQPAMGKTIASLSVLAVNDGSLLSPDLNQSTLAFASIECLDILHLVTNVGHQRAITIALAYADAHFSCDAIVIMDADGEDRPQDALRLVENSIEHPHNIILADRTKRSEGWIFRTGYAIYKALYRILCGAPIKHGNFCLIPADLLSRVASLSDIWNHFAAGIMRSKLPMVSIPTKRGIRYLGRTHMSFVALLVHGMSGISVHLETVAARVLIATAALVAAAVSGFLVVSTIKLFTDLAIPGWASTVGLSFLLIAIQGVFASILLLFIVLNNRQQKAFIPQVDFKDFLKEVDRVYQKDK